MSEDRTRLANGGEEHLAALHSGYRLGRYELQAVLGHGGFGITNLINHDLVHPQIPTKVCGY